MRSNGFFIDSQLAHPKLPFDNKSAFKEDFVVVSLNLEPKKDYLVYEYLFLVVTNNIAGRKVAPIVVVDRRFAEAVSVAL